MLALYTWSVSSCQQHIQLWWAHKQNTQKLFCCTQSKWVITLIIECLPVWICRLWQQLVFWLNTCNTMQDSFHNMPYVLTQQHMMLHNGNVYIEGCSTQWHVETVCVLELWNTPRHHFSWRDARWCYNLLTWFVGYSNAGTLAVLCLVLGSLAWPSLLSLPYYLLLGAIVLTWSATAVSPVGSRSMRVLQVYTGTHETCQCPLASSTLLAFWSATAVTSVCLGSFFKEFFRSTQVCLSNFDALLWTRHCIVDLLSITCLSAESGNVLTPRFMDALLLLSSMNNPGCQGMTRNACHLFHLSSWV